MLALAAAVTAMPALADDVRSVETAAGQEVVVGRHGTWIKRCQGGPPPQVLVTQPPANGTLDTRPGDATLQTAANAALSRGVETCIGTTVAGIHVVYHPKSGFHGTDVVHYTTAYRGGETIPHVITIVVH